jgi:hypothetical protein
MAKVLRRSIPHWLWLLIVMMVMLGVFGWFSLNKPLPEYLVARGEVSAGTVLQLESFELVPLNLGVVSGKYLSVEDYDPALQVIDTIAAGELIPLSNLTSEIPQGQTAIRIVPALEVPQSVVPGSWVSIWRVVEQDEQFTTELLVPRSKVVSIIAPEGLFANSIPQVELLIDTNASILVMQSITAENDIYLLPLP